MARSRKLLQYALRVAMAGASLALGLWIAYPIWLKSIEPRLLDHALASMPQEERDKLYQQMEEMTTTLWDVVPEPLVSRIAKKNRVVWHKGTEVRTNNAGQRASRPYRPKKPDRFRIVCLGDSFVFGAGGPESDRFCDQIEAFYAEHEVRIDGKAIEALAVGIESWTMVQMSTYMTSRLSAYDPDVVLVLTASNDISDAQGVTGTGVVTRRFSPERRDWGSGVFSNMAAFLFGLLEYSALYGDLCPESLQRWEKGMAALARLEDLQRARGGKILLSVLHDDDYFTELYKHYRVEASLQSPALVTGFARSAETLLEHDWHPNRLGHSILAAHYLNAMHELGWIPVDGPDLPELDPSLDLDLDPRADPRRLQALRQAFVDDNLSESLDFDRLARHETRAFLGGLFPEKAGPESYTERPWASVRSGFLLKRPASEARAVEMEIEIQPLPELFPFEISLSVDGRRAADFAFEAPAESTVYRLLADLPPGTGQGPAVEILLETDSYFTGIRDTRMKSFQPISARLVP